MIFSFRKVLCISLQAAHNGCNFQPVQYDSLHGNKEVCYETDNNSYLKTILSIDLKNSSQKHIIYNPVNHGGESAVNEHGTCNFEHICARAEDSALWWCQVRTH